MVSGCKPLIEMEAVALSIRNSSGTIQSRATVFALLSVVTPDENILYQYDGTGILYQGVTYDGETTFEGHRSKAFIPGQRYTKPQFEAYFPTPTFTSLVLSATGVAPVNVPAAGGTAITIYGTNLDGVTNVTFGGTSATSVVVVSTTKVTCVTPAKAAATVAVVVVDDVTAALSAGNITYV